MASRTLFLIRHGETAFTTARRFCGHRDPPLNRRGLLQARAVARHLADRPLGAVFASDLLRARETAAIVAAPHGLPVRIVPGLREIGFGAWEGRLHADVQREAPEAYAAFSASPCASPAPGAEAFRDFAARVWEAFLEVQAAPGPPVRAVVAHGGVLRVILGRLRGLPVEEIPWAGQRSAALNELVGDGSGWRIVRLDAQIWSEEELAEEG